MSGGANMFDVVMVAESGYALRALASIAERTIDPDETMLIILDRTSDGCIQKLTTDFPIASIPSDPSVQRLVELNQIMAGTTAPFIVLCRDDIVVRTDGWLERMMNAFRENTACVGPDTPSQMRTPRPSLKGGGIGLWPLDFSCVMFSSTALKRIGGFDEELPSWFPDDWQMRAYMDGWNFQFADDVSVDSVPYAFSMQEEKTLRQKWAPVFESRE